MKKAVLNRDWSAAADEMVNSRWYGQPGGPPEQGPGQENEESQIGCDDELILASNIGYLFIVYLE